MALSRFFELPISQAPKHNLKEHKAIWPNGIFSDGENLVYDLVHHTPRASSREAIGEITEFAIAIDRTSPKRNGFR